jgi:hypothetical protein
MRPTRALAVAALTAVLTLSACSTGGDDDGSGGDTGAAPNAAMDEADAPRRDANSRSMDSVDGAALNSALQPEEKQPDAMERAIISTGNVQLHSDDVEKTVFDVQALVDRAGGEITDRETGTDDEGDVRMARLVLRIPAERFSQAFTALEGTADLVSSNQTSEDVTTQIIDVDARIRAQRASLSRVEVLLGQAQSIRDIVAIESQLTRRQADLDSLVKRQAFLRDQTSMSTVTVNIQRTPDEQKTKEEKEDDDAGFLSGLEGGWDALTSFATGLATVTGALLPWTIALLLVGGPLWLLLRRFDRFSLRRRTPARTPSDA